MAEGVQTQQPYSKRFSKSSLKDEHKKNFFAIAKELGSDVPFFGKFLTNTRRRNGRETHASFLDIRMDFNALSSKNISIATAWAYFEWEKTKPKTTNGNDFEPIVFSAFPELAYRKEVLKNLGAEKVALSGSGGTVFGVFSEKEKAEKKGRKCENLGDWTAVCPFAE